MNKFSSKQEEFAYYVLKSEWYKKQGDEFNRLVCLEKATAIKAELDKEEKSQEN